MVRFETLLLLGLTGLALTGEYSLHPLRGGGGAAEKGARTEYYVDPIRGDDAGAGTLDKPWKTLSNSIPRLKPGQTLYLREGLFSEKEISIPVRGTEDQPITIRNYDGESPVVDGGMPDFRVAGNSDWEVADPAIQLYVSKNTYPDPKILHGYFDFDGALYKLVGYDDYAELSAKTQFHSQDVPFYVGPGVHWRKSDRKIYIRLLQSDVARQNGYALAGLPADPRKLKIYLFGNGTVLRAHKEAAYIHLEGLTVRFQEHALEFVPGGAGNFSAKNCRFVGGRFHIFVGEDSHDLLFDGITIDGGVPDWIAWLDVKADRRPAKHLETPGIKLTRGVRNVEVKNSSFQRLFDGVNANGGGSNVYLHHNLFGKIRDDCLQLGTHTHDVEVAYNRMIHVSKGPGFQGTTDSERPGTKYYHHNIIDCSQRWLFARRDAQGKLAIPNRVKYIDERGQVWARPVGFHGENAVKDPWKIYHNTIIFGQELNGTGGGFEYPHGPFDPGTPQSVFNNIIIQVADYWLSSGARVSDGSQVFDGNLYYRIPNNATRPFIKQWAGTKGTYDFQSLTEFKASSLFAESKRYYPRGFENSGVEGDPGLDREYRPATDGPAATGAVSLPAEWPGNRGEKFRGALAPSGSAH